MYSCTCMLRSSSFLASLLVSTTRKALPVGRFANCRALQCSTMASSKLQLEHEKLYSDVTSLIRGYLLKYRDRSSKVVDFKRPEELRKLIDLSLHSEGEPPDTLLELCKKAMEYSVHTAHPHFNNTLWSGIDEIGMLGSFIATATNTNVYTYEMAPVYSLMEMEVLREMRRLVGWDGCEGILVPGGSISTLYGLLMARYSLFPEVKEKGVLSFPQMVLFTSRQSHYSVQKSAIVLGIGLDNVVKVATLSNGKMIPEDLDQKIAETKANDKVPLAVVATAGTTVLGAFDPIPEIADVCQKHSVWLHIDGALGGSVLVSKTHRHLLKGAERADSITWNAHKALGAPLQCSAFLPRQQGLLAASNSTQASYLFMPDKVNYDVSFDMGDKTIQCGRLNDALKIWLMWKAKGTAGFEKLIDHTVDMAQYLCSQIKKREGFKLVIEPQEFSNVSFWYTPPALRLLSDTEWTQQIGKVAPIVKARMMDRGSLMIAYQPLEDLPNFFRMAIASPHACKSDMDFVLDEIEREAQDITV